MSVQETIPKSGWVSFLDQITKDHEGDDGHDRDPGTGLRRPGAGRAPAPRLYLLRRRGRRHRRRGRRPKRTLSSVAAHMVSHPAAVLADPLLPGLTRALDIVDVDGNQTLVHIVPTLELPAR